jgi:CheY-like chemotaxis protein
MAADRAVLAGIRILVVEDVFLIASSIAELLQEVGAEVIGPAGELTEAIRLAQTGQIDGALLDVDLHGQTSFEVAAALNHRGIPFVFVTGYGDANIPGELRQAPLLGKPFRRHDFLEALESAFGNATRSAA